MNTENLLYGDPIDIDVEALNEKSDSSRQNNYKSLLDFINDENFFQPISTTVDKSKGELLMMILKYSISNSLSTIALTNLINTIFKTPVLPDSQYIVDKLLNPKNETQFHTVCQNCSAYLGEFEEAKSVQNCSICNLHKFNKTK